MLDYAHQLVVDIVCLLFSDIVPFMIVIIQQLKYNELKLPIALCNAEGSLDSGYMFITMAAHIVISYLLKVLNL